MNEKAVAMALIDALKTKPDVVDEVGQRFYANFAPAEVKPPFMVYRIQEAQELSKDGGALWPVELILVYGPEGYLAALTFEEKITALLQDTDFEVLPSDNRPDPDSDRLFRVMNLQITNA